MTCPPTLSYSGILLFYCLSCRRPKWEPSNKSPVDHQVLTSSQVQFHHPCPSSGSHLLSLRILQQLPKSHLYSTVISNYYWPDLIFLSLNANSFIFYSQYKSNTFLLNNPILLPNENSVCILLNILLWLCTYVYKLDYNIILFGDLRFCLIYGIFLNE